MPSIAPSAVPPAVPYLQGDSSVRGAWRMPAWLLGALAGAALQLQQPQLWSWPVYGVLLALGGVAWLASGSRGVLRGASRLALGRRGGHARALGLAACAGALALFALCGLRAGFYASHALAPGLEGRDLRVTGVIAAMPQVNEGGVRLRLKIESALWQGTAVTLPPLVDVSWYGDAALELAQPADALRQPPTLRAGERWEMTVRLKAPHGARNPHGFDFELWMWEQGVQATGYVRTGANDLPPVRLASTWRHPVERARQAVRDAIVARLAGSAAAGEAGPGRVAGVVAALVTGDQRAIDRADWDVFRATGVAHLMSISGLHITLFAWLAALVVRRLWRCSPRLCLAIPAPTAALVAGVLLAGAYALFSGWGVPAQRTVLMLATIAALQLSGRRWPWPQVWLLACAVVVVVDPWALWQAGFWLSFVAVAVLFAANPIAAGADRASAAARFYALLREQWVVTLALTPLTLLLFGQVSLVGFAANLLAIPWVTLVVTPLALAGVLWAPLWSLAAWALQPFAVFLHWLAAWPLAVAFVPMAPLWAGVAAVVGGGATGHARALGGACAGAAFAAARAVVAAGAACAGPVRTARCRHRPGQRRAGAHRHACAAV